MTKVIIMSGSSLDSFYEQTLQYLHDKYHTYPTSLLGIPVSDSEAAEIGYNDAMGRQIASEARHRDEIPLGKRVV